MKQLAAFILGLFLTSPALADGTINTLSAGAALTGTELLPMFQTANPALTTTPNALKTFVTATGVVTSVAAGCGTTASPSPITTTGTIFAAEVPNLRAGTTYTLANADCGTLNNFSNAASIAVTLPQAGSGGNFANGWYNDVCSIGAGTATITPTTSTIGGVATLVLTTNKCARIVSDGTNYQVVTYGGGGSGTPGGANTNVQFNNSGAFGGDAGFTYTTLGQVTIAGGTITTNNKALTITQTWNNAATTFDAPLLVNITNTASAAGSLVADLQVGGSSVFNVTKAGLINVPGQAGSAPATAGIQFASSTGQPSAIYVNGAINDLEFSANGSASVMALWGSNTVFLNSIGVLNWKVAPLGSGVLGDTGIVRGNTGYLALYDPVSPTTATGFAVYNTVDTATGPTNYERGVFDWTTTANVLTVGTANGGTGSARSLHLSANNTTMTFGQSTFGYISVNFAGGGFTLANGIFLGFSGSGGAVAGALISADSGIGRVLAALLEVHNGTAAGVAQLRINGQTITSLPGGTAPACNATYSGARATVNNSSQTFSSANFGAIISTTTGTNVVPVVCDGANWRIG